jgi:hypothetical protein
MASTAVAATAAASASSAAVMATSTAATASTASAAATTPSLAPATSTTTGSASATLGTSTAGTVSFGPVEVGLALWLGLLRKVTAAFKGHWTTSRTAFQAGLTAAHLGALFLEDGFAREANTVALDG